MWLQWFGRMSERRVERARREVSVSNIIADVCVPTTLLGNYCCVRVVCWAVGGAPSRVRALQRRGGGVSCGAAPRAVWSHFPPRWYVAHAFRAQAVAMHPWRQRGGTAWAASRVPPGWAAGHQLAGTKPAPLWRVGGRRERRAEATGKQLGRPRKRGPARRGVCSGVSSSGTSGRVSCNIGRLWCVEGSRAVPRGRKVEARAIERCKGRSASRCA